MYYISVTWSYSTELARLQQCLRSNFNLHSQALLTLPSWELLILVHARAPRPFAFACNHGGEGSVCCRVGGQDDRVRNRPAAVWDINACVAVVFLIMGGEWVACWYVRNRMWMGESGDVFVPVLPESPAANAVPLERSVVLPALCALPCILRTNVTHSHYLCFILQQHKSTKYKEKKEQMIQTCMEISVSVSSLRHWESSSGSSCIWIDKVDIWLVSHQIKSKQIHLQLVLITIIEIIFKPKFTTHKCDGRFINKIKNKCQIDWWKLYPNLVTLSAERSFHCNN